MCRTRVFLLITLVGLIRSENQFERILFSPSSEVNSIKQDEQSIAAKFLQHYQSNNPVVILLDNVPSSYQDASNFYNKLKNYTKINFMLMEFHEEGVSPILETTYNNEGRFESLLSKKVKHQSTSSLGNEGQNKTAAFFGISNAAEKLPSNSAILVFINREINDKALTLVTLTYVKRSRVKVYVVWGRKPSGSAEEAFLKEFTVQTGGEFFYASKKLSDQYYEEFLENLEYHSGASTILSQKKLKYQKNLNFPINSDVTSIYINISPKIMIAMLTTPSGKRINVLDGEEVAKYGFGSFTKSSENGYEIHLNTTSTPASTQDVGIWYFLVNNADVLYDIEILVHSKLTTDAFITFINATEGSKKIVQLQVNGDVTSIKNISLLTKDGKPIRDNVNFTLTPDKKKSETIQNVKNEIKLDVDVPNEPFYAIVNGKDSQGHDFKRLSYVSQNYINNIFNVPKLTIDVGVGSELITEANRYPEILFEVTNNDNQVSLVHFQVNDEHAMLLRMEPLHKWISPQETAVVRLTLVTKSGVNSDSVTFTASGASVIKKRLLVEVGHRNLNDNQAPSLDYKFLSNCNEIIGSCSNGAWSVEIKARDPDSGLLQLKSVPKGLYFNDGFTAGTRNEVTGYFAQSCCHSDFQIIAVDRNNNRATKTINAYRAPLGAGAIAAIVLGILFLILLIIFIIYVILHPHSKSESGSFDLPTYRGPSGRKS